MYIIALSGSAFQKNIESLCIFSVYRCLSNMPAFQKNIERVFNDCPHHWWVGDFLHFKRILKATRSLPASTLLPHTCTAFQKNIESFSSFILPPNARSFLHFKRILKVAYRLLRPLLLIKKLHFKRILKVPSTVVTEP